jgi:hypothetical protein
MVLTFTEDSWSLANFVDRRQVAIPAEVMEDPWRLLNVNP